MTAPIPTLISQALGDEFLREKGFGPPAERTHTWASGWHPCERSMALDLLHPEDREPPGDDGCARMAHGSDFEQTIIARLKRAGRISEPRFAIEGEQEAFSLRNRDGRVVATGKIDGFLRFEGERRRIVLETKDGESVRRCRTLEEALSGFWSAKYVRQILLYMLGTGTEDGLLIFGSGGLPTMIHLALSDHLEIAEQFWRASEIASGCKHDSRALPSFSSNPGHCLRCDHRGKSCAPPWYSGEGPYVSDSEELAEMVETVLTHDEAAKAHASAKKRLGDLCRGKDLVLIKEHTLIGRPWGKGWRTEIVRQGGEDDAE